MSSTTAEEALLRAKAIAAKLTGQDVVGSYGDGGVSTTTDTTLAASTTSKRKRWGVAPAIVQEAAAVSPLMAVKKFKAGAPEASSSNKKIWVRTTKERGAAHFKAYFATRLISLQDELNEGKSDDGKVTLELQGRGSSGKPLPGVPVEPLHILITGSDTAIVAAELPVDDVLTQAEQAPVEAVDPEEDTGPEPSLNGDNSMALTTTGNPYTSNSAYRPATVAQLISNNPIHHVGGGDLIEETINVPNGMVGFLIGRGGETITSMQARSGCKVQIQKEQDLVPGQTHRVITLEATSQDSIDQCRQMIESMVQDRMRAAGGTFGGGGGGGGGGGSSKDAKVQEALSMGHALVELEVPDADVGLIIGKGGMTIKSIQDQTGAQVQIPPRPADDKPEVRTVSITHPTEEGAQLAKRRIEDVLASKPSFSEDRRVQGPQVTVQIMVRVHDKSVKNA
jgi:far upstream element-binding protein